MKFFKKAVITVLILSSCVGCDQVTKAVARHTLASLPPIDLMGEMIRLHYTENTGAFLGMGAALPEEVRFWILIVFVSVMLIGMLTFILTYPEMDALSLIGGGLVIGGGFSNLLDRLFRGGAVVDFMNVGVGNLRTGIFNVADLAIVFGVGIMLVWDMFFRTEK
jgi:signal peptidase II